MQKTNITLKTIATECSVSVMTVSRALNPRHHKSMRPETRDRILKAIDKYGYTSNPTARRLKRQKADAITLVMGPRVMKGPAVCPDFDAHHECNSWNMVRGVITEARKLNYDVKIESLLDKGLCDEVIAHIKPQLTDGVIFSNTSELEPVIEYIRKNKIPSIILEHNFDLLSSDRKPCVAINRSSGFVSAFEHLWNKGHRKIAFFGNQKQKMSNYTRKIFESYFSEKNSFNQDFIFSLENIYDLRNLLNSFNGNFPFTAILCLNDTMADFTVRELIYMKYRVPEDIAVIGIDGNPTYQRSNASQISTIKLPWLELAETGTHALINLIEEGENSLKTSQLLEAEFIQGKTS